LQTYEGVNAMKTKIKKQNNVKFKNKNLVNANINNSFKKSNDLIIDNLLKNKKKEIEQLLKKNNEMIIKRENSLSLLKNKITDYFSKLKKNNQNISIKEKKVKNDIKKLKSINLDNIAKRKTLLRINNEIKKLLDELKNIKDNFEKINRLYHKKDQFLNEKNIIIHKIKENINNNLSKNYDNISKKILNEKEKIKKNKNKILTNLLEKNNLNNLNIKKIQKQINNNHLKKKKIINEGLNKIKTLNFNYIKEMNDMFDSLQNKLNEYKNIISTENISIIKNKKINEKTLSLLKKRQDIQNESYIKATEKIRTYSSDIKEKLDLDFDFLNLKIESIKNKLDEERCLLEKNRTNILRLHEKLREEEENQKEKLNIYINDKKLFISNSIEKFKQISSKIYNNIEYNFEKYDSKAEKIKKLLLNEKNLLSNKKQKIQDLNNIIKNTNEDIKNKLNILKDQRNDLLKQEEDINKKLDLRKKKLDEQELNLIEKEEKIIEQKRIAKHILNEIKDIIPSFKTKSEMIMMNFGDLKEQWNIKHNELILKEKDLNNFKENFMPHINNIEEDILTLKEKEEEITDKFNKIENEKEILKHKEELILTKYESLKHLKYDISDQFNKIKKMQSHIGHSENLIRTELKSISKAEDLKKKIPVLKKSYKNIMGKIKEIHEEALAKYLILKDKEEDIKRREANLELHKEQINMVLSKFENEKNAFNKLKTESIFKYIKDDTSPLVTNLIEEPKELSKLKIKNLISDAKSSLINNNIEKAQDLLIQIEKHFKKIDIHDSADISYEIMELKTDIKLANL
jgi:hypothetical protein